MATTTHFSWTYPSEYEDPWYTSFKSFVDSVDDKFYEIYSGGPTFAHLHLSDLAAITTAAESWVGPSDTTGVYFKGGFVGIGTTPNGKLDVLGSIHNDTSLTWNAVSAAIIGSAIRQLSINIDSVDPYQISLQGRNNSNAAVNILLNPLGGNVGIGTTSPGSPLDVNGAGHFQGSVTATSYVTASPFFVGDALTALAGIKGDEKGDLDHATLPIQVLREIYERDAEDKIHTIPGCDLGMMIMMQTVAIQQINDRLIKLEKK